FVFGCGWRTGSTLLQRVLCSHPEVHIWGENRGLVTFLREAARTVAALEPASKQHQSEFQRRGTNAWIALLNPCNEQFRKGLKALLETYYGEPARHLGKCRWGFKEVRHDLTAAAFLRDLYPD